LATPAPDSPRRRDYLSGRRPRGSGSSVRRGRYSCVSVSPPLGVCEVNDAILWLVFILAIGNAVGLVVLVGRSGRSRHDHPDALRDELRTAREEAGRAAQASRAELAQGLASANATLSLTLKSMGEVQQAQLNGLATSLKQLSESNQASLERVRTTVDARVRELQQGNEQKLEAMRKTVDEQLQTTLEKRLGESFKLVSDQLESVQKGLGEMQSLASGVGDLKRVLTNVKARGTWAEVQLGALLDEMLAPSQFERNVHVEPGSRELVEFAVKLPGPKDEPGACVWLPIDSKLPQEDYMRLQDAADCGDRDAEQCAADALGRAIKVAAQDIHDKYVKPPHTTDFAIMFLATEGLYAEVVRQPALVDDLQHRFRVVVAGPTTLAALLSSLRMGFQTLAIEQQAVEVWRVLGAVKTEFAKFGGVLDKVKRQLDAASHTIEQTGVRTRAMERRLRKVEQLPEAEAGQVLELALEPALGSALVDEAEAIGPDDADASALDGEEALVPDEPLAPALGDEDPALI
jgi:DNA recombination protein RmuC